MRLTVVSTGNGARTKQICIGSVARQIVPESVSVGHVYVEASEQDPSLPASQNLFDAVNALDSDDVCLWLDGDDWLANDHVCRFIAALYGDPDTWLTYGSYAFADGRIGHCSAYENEAYRASP